MQERFPSLSNMNRRGVGERDFSRSCEVTPVATPTGVYWEAIMSYRSRMGVFALALGIGFAGAVAAARSQVMDLGKYPDIAGGWGRSEVYQWARGEKPPLTPEYQAVLDSNLADRATGGHGTDTMYRCFPPGMPRQMHLYSPM